MSPHYNRQADDLAGTPAAGPVLGGGPDDQAMEDAAERLREVEVEAVQPDVPDVASLDPSQLESMNIDELRVEAKELDIPERATITEKDELIAAIRQRL